MGQKLNDLEDNGPESEIQEQQGAIEKLEAARDAATRDVNDLGIFENASDELKEMLSPEELHELKRKNEKTLEAQEDEITNLKSKLEQALRNVPEISKLKEIEKQLIDEQQKLNDLEENGPESEIQEQQGAIEKLDAARDAATRDVNDLGIFENASDELKEMLSPEELHELKRKNEKTLEAKEDE